MERASNRWAIAARFFFNVAIVPLLAGVAFVVIAWAWRAFSG